MTKVSGNVLDINLLGRVFRYVGPYRMIFIWSILLTVLLAILAPLRPWLIQFTLDNYILFNDHAGLI
ncbi:MAG: ABC transporter ATP-binding protein, partial [Bacteroidetes bacterium]|nr:ABC transporter ATP-binding protein [Bacteroidota bacterium]